MDIFQPVLLMFCVILQQRVEKENELLHPHHPERLYFPRELALVTSAWTDHSIKTTQTSDILLASSAHNEFPFPSSHLLTERLGKNKNIFWVTFHLQMLKIIEHFERKRRIMNCNRSCRKTRPGSPRSCSSPGCRHLGPALRVPRCSRWELKEKDWDMCYYHHSKPCCCTFFTEKT